MTHDEYALQPDASWQPLDLPGALAGRSGGLLPDRGVTTPLLRIGSEHRLYVTVAASQAAQVELLVRPAGEAAWQPLARCAASPSQQLEISLAAYASRQCEFRLAAVQGRVHALEFCICAAQRHGRMNAFTGYGMRLANELRHFSGDAYTHRMYGESAAGRDARGEVTRARTQDASLAAWPEEVHARCRARLAAMPAEPDEPAFTYAMRTLSVLVPPHGRTFVDRVQEMSRQGPLKILSLCAGAARIEEDLLAVCEGPVQLTLVDASEDLLQRAAGRLGGRGSAHHIECLVGDVNEGLPGEGEYDIIVCVSALHHIADLERVLAGINQRLAGGGQFWSIGEQVGRNGNRLWPDALEAANRAFAQLPPHLRRNAHTGEVDAEVSDRDYSVGCFEGVRSQELEELMERYLVLTESYKRNAFLWRLVDGTYTDNYDLSRAGDLGHLRELIAAEVAHWAAGGRSTEFYGVFRKKTA
jgi:SAM-dependent methyltransferase